MVTSFKNLDLDPHCIQLLDPKFAQIQNTERKPYAVIGTKRCIMYRYMLIYTLLT